MPVPVNSLSAKVTFLLAALIIAIRCCISFDAVISWDIFGYYIYLPARFIYHDPSMWHIEWVQNIFNQYHPSATLYQINDLQNGMHATRYPIGPAFLSFPFFAIAHLYAKLSHAYAADGFSYPYRLAYGWAAVFYTLVGLFYLRKVLLHFFSEVNTSIVLVLIVLGTNYLQLVTEKNTLPHNYLFSLYSILLYYTIKWHTSPRTLYALLIGFITGVIAITRPNEVLIGIIPVLWGIHNRQSLKEKFNLLNSRKKDIALAALAFIIGILPQLLYWKLYVGKWLYYSYINPAEGFDILTPYTLKFLFSFRKGWLIYTPMMFFAFAGFYYLYKRNKALFFPLIIFTAVNLYIVSSWTCWWYAAGSYSSRSEMPSYSLLALPLGYFVEMIRKKKLWAWLFAFFSILFIALNLFQWRQAFTGVLDGDRMTRAYYFRTFGKLNASDEDRKLLLVARSLDGKEGLKDIQNFDSSTVADLGFEDFDISNKRDYSAAYSHSGHYSYKMDSVQSYSPGPDIKYKQLTTKEYAWIRASVWVYVPGGNTDKAPMLVVSFHHKDKPYKFTTTESLGFGKEKGIWEKYTLDYMTPEVRNPKDNMKVFVWYTGKQPVYIDDLHVEKFEPRQGN